MEEWWDWLRIRRDKSDKSISWAHVLEAFDEGKLFMNVGIRSCEQAGVPSRKCIYTTWNIIWSTSVTVTVETHAMPVKPLEKEILSQSLK